MEIYKNIPFELDLSALMQTNRIRSGSSDADEFTQLAHLAGQIGKPKAMFTEVYLALEGEENVLLNGFRFTSSMLYQNMTNVERVFPYIVTCGHEMDQTYHGDGNFLAQFWWDTIKESMLTSAMLFLENTLQRRYLLKKTSTMSPGSGDANVWPIEQQRELFNLLGDVHDAIGVELTDSYLMIPNKTISGIFFPTEKDFRTCQVCHRENCPSRSAPFDQILWESIQSD